VNLSGKNFRLKLIEAIFSSPENLLAVWVISLSRWGGAHNSSQIKGLIRSHAREFLYPIVLA